MSPVMAADYLDPCQSRRRSWWSPLCLSLGDNFHKTGRHYPELALQTGETGWLGWAGIHGYWWLTASLLRSLATGETERERRDWALLCPLPGSSHRVWKQEHLLMSCNNKYIHYKCYIHDHTKQSYDVSRDANEQTLF